MTEHVDPAGLLPSLSRREVMLGAAGLTFAVALGRGALAQAPGAAALGAGKALSPWVTIAPDGTIFIMSPVTEMGQGSTTALPRVIAEELDADWDKVRIVPAPPVESQYGNPAFGGMMYTAGSNAVTAYFKNLRVFGAQVRRVLLDNAAKHWDVPVAELTTEPSAVVHARTGRRLGYGEIAAFAEVPATAPEVKPEELKKPSEFRLIGKDVMRHELPGKVDGSARYSIDVQVPGMLYGAILRAPVEGSNAESVDDSKARAITGVLHVARLPFGLGVIADTPWAAFAAKDQLARDVTWSKAGKAWGFDSDEGVERMAGLARDPATEVKEWFKQGDPSSELPRAEKIIEAEYRCDYAYHAQMEPLNATASVSPAGDAVEIWCGTQSQTMAVEAAATALGIDRTKVKLNDMLLGGGFGRRGHRDEEFILDAVLLSKELKRPVKVLWTREDDVQNARLRPLSAHFVRAGLDGTGKLTAWQHRVAGDRVLPYVDPIRFQRAGQRDPILMLGVELKSYDIPHQLSQQVLQDTGVRTSPLRGIGYTANKFVTEAFLDEIASARGIDPVALRLELLKDTPRGRAVVEKVVQMSDWVRKRQGRGLGFAFIEYSGTLLAGVAEVSVDRPTGEIKVHDFWCAMDCGIAVHPDNVLAQTESSIVYGLGMALTERISIRDGVIEQSNFSDYQIPRMRDVPDIHIALLPTENHPTGVGQMATPLVAPAIAAAVAQLTGARLRHSPFTPERVKAALA